MSQEDDRRALLDYLGIREPAMRTFTLDDRALQATEVDRGLVQDLRARLERDPETVLANAPSWLGASPTVDDVLRMLLEAEQALERPRETLAALRALHDSPCLAFPIEHQFPGYDPAVCIRPDSHKFETVADSLAWAATAAAALSFRLTHRKPDLPEPAADAVYPLAGSGGVSTVALFSDWGTGYYHSQYIARHIRDLGAHQAVHLGDVYYTGRESEFQTHVRPLLDPLLDAMPVYLLNANHEMDTHGLAYLDYLKYKSARGQQQGHPQPQETSVFCLRNSHVQLLALDTAYGKNGRFGRGTPAWMTAWAEARLREGAEKKLTTILLTQNEPYGPGRFGDVAARATTPLVNDLAPHLSAGRIHAWFWGDQHYAALYAPAQGLPFFGSCIGHGGYPFYTRQDDSRAGRDVAPLLWCERASRFPPALDLRPDVGRNGFCFLTLTPASVEFRYIDWMRGTRAVATFARSDSGGLVGQSVSES